MFVLTLCRVRDTGGSEHGRSNSQLFNKLSSLHVIPPNRRREAPACSDGHEGCVSMTPKPQPVRRRILPLILFGGRGGTVRHRHLDRAPGSDDPVLAVFLDGFVFRALSAERVRQTAVAFVTLVG